MKRKEISDGTRFLRLAFLFIAMLASGTLVDYFDHGTIRSWLAHTFAPIALGTCIAFLCFYLAMKLKHRVLKMPEGL